MPNVSYDTLSIKIEADSSQANSSISKLSASLRKLDEASKELDFGKIKEVRGLLQSIAKIDFSNVTNGLQSVVTAFKSLSASSKKTLSGVKESLKDSVELEKVSPVFDTSSLDKKIPFAVMVDEKSIDNAKKEIEKTNQDLLKEVKPIDIINGKVNIDVDPAEIDKIKKDFEAIREQASQVKPISFDVDPKTIEVYNTSLQKLTEEFSKISVTGKNAVEVINDFLSPTEEFAQKLYEVGLNATQVKAVFNSMDYETDIFNQEQLDEVYEGLIKLGKTNEEAIEIIGRLKQEAEETTNAFSSLGLNASQTAELLKAINFERKTFNVEEIEIVTKALEDMGYSSDKVKDIIAHLGKEFEELKKKAEKPKTALQRLLSQFAKIMKYRIIRKVIQEIYKALQEGIKNVIAFDSATSDAVNQLRGKFGYLKNSIGSMLAPLIQIVTPILTELMTLVGNLGNAFAEVFAGANGQTTFAKAKDDVEGYNEALKKTQALGIDELNVMQQENNDMFTEEQVNLGGEMGQLANTLKDAFAKIKDVLGKVFKIIVNIVNKLLPLINNVLQPITEILGVIIDLIMTLLEDTFEDVGENLVSFTNMISNILGFVSTLARDLAPALKQIIHWIGSALNIINTIISFIYDIVGGIFQVLEPIIHVILVALVPVLNVVLTIVTTILRVCEAIVKTIIAVVTFKWGEIGKIWQEATSDIGKAWQDMAEGNAKIYGYATGGFPEDGFFFANHNELVGRFDNGKTAVANNEQITQGIYEAVRDAMKESGGQGISIQIDGQELAKVIKKKQDNFGADLFVGGNLAYGK